MPRIKLDLTAKECVVLPPIPSQVFHPYSDAPDGGITIRSYAYEEVFGEKIRALAERTRPRDLYDVINLFRNAESRPDAGVFRDVLLQKCKFKGIDFPSLDQLESHRPSLENGWTQMLAHQLPSLPRPIDLAHRAILLVRGVNRAAFFVTQLLITLRPVPSSVD